MGFLFGILILLSVSFFVELCSSFVKFKMIFISRHLKRLQVLQVSKL